MRKKIILCVCLINILSLTLVAALLAAFFYQEAISLLNALLFGGQFALVVIVLNILLLLIFVPKFLKQIKFDFYAPTEADTYKAVTDFVGTLIDDKKQNESEVSNLSFHLNFTKSIYNNIHDGFIILDRLGNIFAINPEAKLFFNIDTDYTGKNISNLNPGDGFSDKVKAALQGHRGQLYIETEQVYSALFLPSKDNGVVIIISDITEEQLAEKKRIEFPANTSHELSAPLTMINGFADLIAKGTLDVDDTVHFARKISSECQRMLNTTESILFLSKLDEMNGPQAFNRFDVSKVAAEAIEYWKDTADKAGVTLSLSATICPIKGNRHLIFSLFSNLISNAVLYNKLRGTVKIAVSLKNNHAYINVADTGVGFTKEEHHLVFDRFYRTPHALTRDSEGAGLGLSIVRDIVRYHKGTIDLESEPGAGTRVFVKIPQEA